MIQPSAASSPAWVQHLVNSGATIWSNHPVQAATATVWIQLGLGVWLLVAPRGRWSRLGGAATVAWGLLVWVFGESFGGIFGPGLTWLFGAPGAVLFYCAAGILIALPERAFSTARLGRIVIGLSGVFLIGMAVLQAWPGRGYWQGRGGTLAGMVRTMAQTSQPSFLSSWLSSFASFVDAHGWAVNLFAVLCLATIGGLFLSGRRRLVLGGLIALLVLCIADWVLVEDLGFFGGLGTDPNSMLPMALLFIGGYVAMVRLPAPVAERGGRRSCNRQSRTMVGRCDRLLPQPLVGRCRGGGRCAHRKCADGDGGRQLECRPDRERGTRRHTQQPRLSRRRHSR